MAPTNKTWKCKVCNNMLPPENFAYTQNKFFHPHGYSDICFDCLEDMIDFDDLNEVDRVMQYLDMPLFVDEWYELYEIHSANALRVYCEQYCTHEYKRNDWAIVNRAWAEKHTEGTLDESIALLHIDQQNKWHATWGEGKMPADYVKMDQLYEEIKRTANLVTPIQRDQARKLCALSITIDEKIRTGDDASKEMKMYNDIIKSAGLEPQNSRNYSDFESIGELMKHLVAKGYKPQFYTGQVRDAVDETIANQQAWLKRFAENEPSLIDQVAERKQNMIDAARKEKEGYDDTMIDEYSDDPDKFIIEYEGGDELYDSIDDFTKDFDS